MAWLSIARNRVPGRALKAMDRIGTAGWRIPRTCAEHFPTEGTGLERYAAVLPAAANALELMAL